MNDSKNFKGRQTTITKTPTQAWLSNAKKLASKPITWIAGILVGVVSSYTAATLNKYVSVIENSITEWRCDISQRKTPLDDKRFRILLSPLANDDGNKSTSRLMEAFLGMKSVQVVPLCRRIDFDFSKPIDISADDAVKEAFATITKMKADLLLFGEVLVRDQAVRIWAVNEHGGCDLNPKPILQENGLLPSTFAADNRARLEELVLGEIASACAAIVPIDWTLFETRLQKLRNMIRSGDIDLSTSLLIELLTDYAHAANTLYSHRQDIVYLEEAADLERTFEKKYKSEDAFHTYLFLQAQCDTLGAIADYRKTTLTQDQAIQACTAAINQSTTFSVGGIQVSDAYNMLGILYGSQGSADQSIEQFEKAAAFYDNPYIIFYNIGKQYEAIGRLDDALAAFTKSVQANRFSMGYFGRAEVYKVQEKFDNALSDLDQAISIDPSYFQFFNTKGMVLVSIGRLDDALAEFNIAIKLAGTSNDAPIFNRGRLWERKGLLRKAVEDFTEAIKIDVNDAGAYRARARVFEGLGDHGSSSADLDRAKEIDATKG